MDTPEFNQDEYQEIAELFWPAFWQHWHTRKIYLTYLTIKKGILRWRDDETDSLWWFLRSFLKGLMNIYFLAVMFICVCISECAYLKTLVLHLNWQSNDLNTPLFLALPALIGTTMLDYFLEFRKRPTICIVALVLLATLGYFAYSFHLREPTVNQFYWITLCVIFLAWCIKVGDPKMIYSGRNAYAALPGPPHLSETPLGADTLNRMGKKLILKREKKDVVQ